MLIFHVTYEVKEGMREAFLDKLEELQVGEKSRLEPGNFDYTYYLPAGDKDRDVVFLKELWSDKEAQLAHTQTDHFKALSQVKADYVQNTVIRKFEGDEI